MELLGDALTQLKTIESESVDMMITSPPYYGLRNYGTDPVIWGDNWKGELGSEPTVQLFIQHLLEIFAEVKRVLKQTGTCWINIADTYGGTGYGKGTGNFNNKNNPVCMTQQKDKSAKKKSQLCVPERLVLGMIEQGWIKRNTIIWHKPSCLPSSAKDRFTVDFENLFLFTKSSKYYFEQQFEPYSDTFLNDKRHTQEIPEYNSKYPEDNSIQGGCPTRNNIFKSGLNPKGRNKRAVWHINPANNKEAHFATFPEELITTPILAGCPEGGIVLDPFGGTFTTAVVAYKNRRKWIMIEHNKKYFEMGSNRLKKYTDQEKLF